MEIRKILREIENGNFTEELTKKRYACAKCGTTWTELVGLVIGRRNGNEDLYLRIGLESENCQTCRFRPRQCQQCGSQDVYEINFSEEIPENVPLSFKAIKTISRR
ncbi:MAG: hypothetical protein QXN63_01935 [Candidatus Bathyarchaeia archaeon]